MKKAFCIFLLILLTFSVLLAQYPQYSSNTSSGGFRVVIYGQVKAISGKSLTIATLNGQSATIEPSSKAIFHDGSQVPSTTTTFSKIRQGDEIMVLTDSANKTHIVFLHPGEQMNQAWQGALPYPSIPSVNPYQEGQYPQSPYSQPQYPQNPYLQPQYPQSPYSQPQYPQNPYSQEQYSQNPYSQGYQQSLGFQLKTILYGQIQVVTGNALQIVTPEGQSANIEPSQKTIFHDASQPPAATSSFSQIRQGDEVVIASDSSGNTHIIFLHQGGQMNPAWEGVIAPPSSDGGY